MRKNSRGIIYLKLTIGIFVFNLLINHPLNGQIGCASYNGNTIPIVGYYNSAFGSQALFSSTISTSNCAAFGRQALYSNNTGYMNSAFGDRALFSNTSGNVNTALGSDALYSNTTGAYNVGIGWQALNANTTAYGNIGIGAQALLNNTVGQYNVAVGTASLMQNTLGNYNIGIGQNTLFSNTTGSYNAAFGSGALYSNTTGVNNSGVGYQSLYSNTVGEHNSALGWQALYSNTSGNSNCAYGSHALFNNSTGHSNVGIGATALRNITTGHSNTVIGTSGLIYGSTASLNTGVGMATLYNTTSDFNTAIGTFSLFTNTTGTYNTALGYSANVASNNLTNATAIGNSAIVNNSNSIQLGNSSVTTVNIGVGNAATLITGGLQVTGGSPTAGMVLTSTGSTGAATWQAPNTGDDWHTTGNVGTVDGFNFIGSIDKVAFNIRVANQKAGRLDPYLYNVFYGMNAGENNTTGNVNTAIGYRALQANTEGYHNTAIGSDALWQNTTGNFNTGTGWDALAWNTTGYANSGFGEAALFQNTTGKYNSAVGAGTLSFGNTGDFNSALGGLADVSISNLQNATAIGFGSTVNASDKVVIGSNTPGIVIGGYAPWSNFSDGRFKENVKENVPGLEFIKKLRPVTYTINAKKLDEHIMQYMPDSKKAKRFQNNESYIKSENKIQTGFIAQEVEKVATEMGYDFDGINTPKNPTDNYSIAYSQFVVPLVKAVQELSKQNEEMKKELDELKATVKLLTGKNEDGSIQLIRTNIETRLFQNNPNPFNKSTIIRYSIPADAKKAVITITDLNGIKISEFDLISKRGQSIEIAGGKLSSGTYVYSLIVDGRLTDSMKMVLTR